MTRDELGDLAHRVVWTFLEAFTGFLVAAPMVGLDLEVLQSAAGAGVAAVITFVKEAARRRLATSPDL